MVKGLIGRKIEMTQVFDRHNKAVPITKIKVEPNFVVQIKEAEKDGYKSVQLGVEQKKKSSKPQIGHGKKAGLDFSPRILHEFGFEGDLKAGERLEVDQVFRKGNTVDVTGVTKGKGFAGVVKRWGFAGGPRTHGQSDRERAPGSIGATTTPGRVYKGMKMPGHMGNEQVTVQGLEVIEINKEENEIQVAGSIPGSVRGIVFIKKSEKKRRAYHEPEIPQIPVIFGKEEEKEKEGQLEEATEEKEVSVETAQEEPKSESNTATEEKSLESGEENAN
jgi:large subunit ribosomal protein L3